MVTGLKIEETCYAQVYIAQNMRDIYSITTLDTFSSTLSWCVCVCACVCRVHLYVCVHMCAYVYVCILGLGRLCQHNFEHNRLFILVRIMLE